MTSPQPGVGKETLDEVVPDETAQLTLISDVAATPRPEPEETVISSRVSAPIATTGSSLGSATEVNETVIQSGDHQSQAARTGDNRYTETVISTPGVSTNLDSASGSASPIPPRNWGADRNPPQLDPALYELRSFLARGGMGEIWVARDTRIGREVALKTLRAGRGAIRNRFLLEASVTGRLEHPGVVPVHELTTDAAGQPYYSMKLIQGRSLKQAIDEFHALPQDDWGARALRLQELVRACISICETIAYAHSRGIIHRDLKPENAMLGEFGETLVLDWGLARDRSQAPERPIAEGESPVPISGDSTTTRVGVLLGSPAYMAPEIIAGNAHAADERTDIYLLGGTLYEILTGIAPHHGRRITASRETQPAALPHTLVPGTPKVLEAICLKALQVRPADRYLSASEMAEDLKRYLAREPVSVWPESWIERTARWVRRHQTLIGRSVMIGLVLIGIGLVLAQHRENRRLEQIEQARHDVDAFMKLADEAQFLAASTERLDERTPYFDPGQAAQAADKALALSDRWGFQLDDLPLTEVRSAVRDELRNLLLVSVSWRLRMRHDDESRAVSVRNLDRAEALGGPSPGLDALRALCETKTPADSPSAALSESVTSDPNSETATDHFLKAEAARLRASGLASQDSTGRALHREQMEAAITHYRAAIRQQAGHYWAHFQLGRCYLSLGQHAEAIELFGTCIALRPKAVWAWSARGLAFGLHGQQAVAVRDLNTALELDPEFVPARLNRGVTHWLASQSPTNSEASTHIVLALDDFEAVLRSPTPLVEAAYYRAAIRVQAQSVEAALTDLARAISERSNFVPARQLRAQLHFAAGRLDEGIDDLDVVIRSRFPPSATPVAEWQVPFERGRILREWVSSPPQGLSLPRVDLLKRAAQELHTAAQSVTETTGSDAADAASRVFAELGSVLELTGSATEAGAAYSRAIEFAPRDAALWVKRGWLWTLRLARPEAAADDFRQALKIKPDHAEALSALGFLSAVSNAEEAASQSAFKAILSGGGDYLILHNVACIYAELAVRHPDRATQHEQAAIDLIARGIVLWQQGQQSGPDPTELARNEPSFRKLSERSDFQKLINSRQ